MFFVLLAFAVPSSIGDGAKLTWESVVDVGASSSSIPGNGVRKMS
jgi:hypothetical protein